MKKRQTLDKLHPTIFEEKEVRRTWNNEQWFFSITDVVQILTDSVNPQGYIKDMRRRDEELHKGWGQIATPLSIKTKGGIQKVNCANLENIFRIIQSIPSPKAEPFKKWLARVGKERIDEINDPELAVNRAKEIYEKKGYPKDWVEKRMRGIAVRNTLTDEWKNRGAKKGIEYAILTDEIYKGTFEKSAKEYMDYKNLDKKEGDNLRDHMEDLELILTMLGEATTTKITTTKNSVGFKKLKRDAQMAGKIAGNTRKQIEKETGKKITSPSNFKNKKSLS